VQPEATKEQRRVLIADANTEFVATLTERLTALGYRVGSVAARSEIRAAVMGLRPVLILCDMEFFNSSGQLFLKPDSLPGDIPCIGMARDCDARFVAKAFRAGICDFFDKAAPIEELLFELERSFRMQKEDQGEFSYETLWRAKEAAEAANRAKSEFLATISHELRTPLNAILGFSELMMRGVLGPLGNPQYGAYLEDIHQSGSHLLSIINDILDVSKAEAAKLTLEESEVNAVEVVKSVARLMGPRVQDGRLTLSVQLPPDTAHLWCDQRKLKQMLLNLMSNAVKFTPPGGTVDVTAFCGESGLAIHVSDSGIGISPSDLVRVLQPFVQADNKLNRRHEGAGLGLSLVRSMIEIHGGTLRLESEVGVGTTAILTFPPERVIPMQAASAVQEVATA
jgi:signal transduction histidine kinase